jgi:hypothetical protein
MLSHVARVSLFQNINERTENLCLEFFLDKIDYAVLKYLIILIKFIVTSSKLSSEFLIYFLIKKILLYSSPKFFKISIELLGTVKLKPIRERKLIVK